MRILIFADVHANLEALAALQAVETQPDAVLFAGDAVGYGPDPAACVTWLAHNVTFGVQGDHDRAVTEGGACESPGEWREVAEATTAVHRALLPDAAKTHLGMWPEERQVELGGARFWLRHHPPGNLDMLTSSESALTDALGANSCDVILCGHTHVPALRRLGTRWLVNPGSLGQPRHGLPSLTYAVWNDGDLKIQHIDYNPRVTMNKLTLLPFDPEHVARLQEAYARGL